MENIKSKSAEIGRTLKQILFPKDFTCDVCGVETFGTNVCDVCKKKLPLNDGNTCPICGRRTVRPEICLECKDSPPLYKRAVSALVYEKNTVLLISKFKNGKGYLKDYFAELISKKLADFPEIDCIAYIPMTRAEVRRRGYNQGKLLAKSLSAIIGKPAVDALIKTKKTKNQKSLTKRDRADNLSGSFCGADMEIVKGKAVLAVDDVLTTGATADEAVRALIKAGAKCVYFATVASVEYKTVKTALASEIKKAENQ